MHPQAEALYKAIQSNDTESIKHFLRVYKNLPWFLCEFQVTAQGKTQTQAASALTHALTLNQFKIVNLFLDKLFYEAFLGECSLEAQFSFHYALATVIAALCKQDTANLQFFYERPEGKVALLEESRKNWVPWAKDSVVSPEAFKKALNESLKLKPMVQGLIRSYALQHQLTAFFKSVEKYKNHELIDIVRRFSPCLAGLQTQPIFSEHRNFNFSILSYARAPTDTVLMARQLREACDYLSMDPTLNSPRFTLEIAKKIMLLCAKSYPFCSDDLKPIWVRLATLVLSKFNRNPADYHTLYEPLLDKQGVATEDNIPLVESFLLQALLPESITRYLQGYEQKSLAQALSDGKTLYLHTGIGQGAEVLARFPLACPKKCFVFEGPLDDESKHYVHSLMMFNLTLCISYPSPVLFNQNPSELFPHASTRVFIQVADAEQLAYLKKIIEVNAYTARELGVILPESLAAHCKTVMNEIREFLGATQNVSVIILDNLQTRNVKSTFMVLTEEDDSDLDCFDVDHACELQSNNSRSPSPPT